jgi:hypothetical protein
MLRKTLFALALALVAAPSFATDYFTYIPAPEMDYRGTPIIDPKTGKQGIDGFCMYWKDDWVLDNPNVDILGGLFYTQVSYRVDPRAKTMTIEFAKAPKVVATTTGAGWIRLATTRSCARISRLRSTPSRKRAGRAARRPGTP